MTESSTASSTAPTKTTATASIVNSSEGLDDFVEKSWPDPLVRRAPTTAGSSDEEGDPVLPLDDVSRLSCPPLTNANGNATNCHASSSISRLFHPRSEDDLCGIVARAVLEQRRVGIRGTKHSMGGHSLVAGLAHKGRGNYEIDTLRMKRMKYSPQKNLLVCEPGCLWSEIIYYLNRFGKSPRTLQSYASFSVGGTLSVNAHGITTDHCFAESVREFRLVRVRRNARQILQDYFASRSNSNNNKDSGNSCHGLLDRLVEVKVCRRPHSGGYFPPDPEAEELFKLALGGYGLFGIISEVTLDVSDNTTLQLDAFRLNCGRRMEGFQEEKGGSSRLTEFERVYHNVRAQSPKTSSHHDNITAADNDDDDDDDADMVDIKLARLNILVLDSVTLFVFRKTSSLPLPTPSLEFEPRKLSAQSQLLYKWLLPVTQKTRFALEEWTGQALDWSSEENVTRNQLLYESAEPLAKLYNPLFAADDTFVLQEYFVPKARLSDWIEAARPIYQQLSTESIGGNGSSGEEGKEQQHHKIVLLNTTIRYVEHDRDTFLKYAQHPDGVFAFVLYFRMTRSVEADARLGAYHDRFANMTLRLGGTFYLPYRKSYSIAQLEEAYPMIRGFAELKTKHDPLGTFSNQWYEHYLWEHFSDEGWKESVRKWYKTPLWKQEGNTHSEWWNTAGSSYLLHRNTELVRTALGIRDQDWTPCDAGARKELLLTRNHANHLLRRTNSYQRLLRCPESRQRFHQQFLVHIFSVANKDDVFRTMAKAVWDPKNQTDSDIFRDLRTHFHGPEGNAKSETAANESLLTKAMTGWRGLKQLSAQKQELTRQTITLLARLNKLGSTRSICSMGDHGKICLNLIKALEASNPSRESIPKPSSQIEEVVIVHDTELNEMTDLAGVLEKGTVGGQLCQRELFIKYDYMVDNVQERFATIESGSLDLVTMNQGLHHIPVENLESFVLEITRILDVGGVFIFREHDLRVDSKNSTTEDSGSRKLHHLGHASVQMLDLAHSVFNAVTGVSESDECDEIRAFRSIAEWRVLVGLLSGEQLEDAMLFDIEEGDCTWDEMCAFVKKGSCRNDPFKPRFPPKSQQQYQNVKLYRDLEPPVIDMLRGILGQVPSAVFNFFKENLELVGKTFLPPLVAKLKDILRINLPCNSCSGSESTGVRDAAAKMSLLASTLGPKINAFLEQTIDISERLLAMMSDTEIKPIYDFLGILRFSELFLIVPWIQQRVRYSETPSLFPRLNIPGGVSDNEKQIVQAFRKYAPIFLQPETGNPDEDGSIIEDGDLASKNLNSTSNENSIFEIEKHRTITGKKSLGDTGDSQLGSSKGLVTPREILARLHRMELAIPGLLTMKTLQESGLSLRQQATLAAQFIDKDREHFAQILSLRLSTDREIWNAMCIAFDDIERTREKPTLDSILCADKSAPNGSLIRVNANGAQSNHISDAYLRYKSPWHRVLRTFLCSESILLTPREQVGLKFLGLSRLRDIYLEVKAEAKRFPSRLSVNQNTFNDDPAFVEISSNALALLKVADTIGVDKNIKRVQLRFDHRSFHHLTDVGRIVKATFGYKSLTSRPTDITPQLKKYHEDLHLNHVVDVASTLMETADPSPDQNNKHGTRRSSENIHTKQILTAAKASNGSPGDGVIDSNGSVLTNLLLPGSLYVTETLLTEFRNSASGIRRNLDGTRKAVVKMASLGHAGSNVLTLEYVVAEGHPTDSGQNRFSCLESSLLPTERGHPGSFVVDKKIVISPTTKSTESYARIERDLDLALEHFKQLGAHRLNQQPGDQNLPEQNSQASVSPYSSAFYALSHSLFEKKLYKKLHLNQSGQYTWFKLPEWLQVEIIREFGQYLDHTPWYRFPFSKILNTYFSVLRQECEVVRNKYGLRAAYFSKAFLTDAIPGIVMSWLFLQMNLLAKPLRMLPDYDSKDQERMCEQIVLYLPEWNIDTDNSSRSNSGTANVRVSQSRSSAISGKHAERDLVESCVEEVINHKENRGRKTRNGTERRDGCELLSWFREKVDPRISSVRKIQAPDVKPKLAKPSKTPHHRHNPTDPACLLILQTPPFKAFGEILFRLALKFPSARVLEVSNQPEVQIKISLDSRLAENRNENLSKEDVLCWFSDLETSKNNTAKTSQPVVVKHDIVVSVDFTLLDKRYIGLGVKCPVLLNVLRRIAHLHQRIRLEQVYDFWS